MNLRFIFGTIGNVLRYEAFLMLLPILISFYYGDRDWVAFIISMAATFCIGHGLSLLKPTGTYLSNKDGLVFVSFTWVIVSLVAALPFYISGQFDSVVDCIFEAVSAITTTGASIVDDAESLPKGIIFWRSLIHWTGGMGFILLVAVLLPAISSSSIYMLKAEPGPSSERLAPKIKETAKIIYTIYFAMTLILTVLLCVVAKMPLYDSAVHAFGTVCTGGFSNKALSVGQYGSISANIIITIFMILSGVNFAVYYQLFKKDLKALLDEELLFYLAIFLIATVVITIDLSSVYGNIWEGVQKASFHTASMVTTTGFFTDDFTAWPVLSKAILFILMFFGACSGSTSGSLKMVRMLILFKAVKVEVSKVIRPNVINTLKLNRKNVSGDIVYKVFIYFFCHMAFVGAAFLVLSIEGGDFISSLTAAVAAVSNIGIGFGDIGMSGSFASINPFSKVVLSVCMLVGRLEIFPVLALFSPMVWRKT